MLSHFAAAALVLGSSLLGSNAQVTTACNPTNGTCPNDKGLPTSSYSIDFTSLKEVPSEWVLADATKVNLGASGAELTFSKRFDAHLMQTDFHLFYGRVEYVVKAAPGTGIISSMVLLSDDLDEIDWEFRGGITDSVQTNYFGKGYTGTYNRSTTEAVTTPQDTFHTYALDWSKEALIWSIDGKVVRTLKAADADGNGSQYPQTPMKVSLSLWDAGDKDKDPSTVGWAGGYTPLPPPHPYTMYIKSVKVWNANPAQQYQYTDKSGTWKSIKAINETVASSSSSATRAIQTLTLAPVGTTVANTSSGNSSSTAWSAPKPTAWNATVYNTTYGHNSSSLHSTSCDESSTLSSNLSITAVSPSSFVTAARTSKATPAEPTPVTPKSGSSSWSAPYTAAAPSSSVSVKAAVTSGVAAAASDDSTTCTDEYDDTPTAVAKSSSYATSSTLPASGSSAVVSKEPTSQYTAAVTTPVAASTPLSHVAPAPSSSLSVPVSAAQSAVLSSSAPQVPVTSVQSIQAGIPAASASSTSSECTGDAELMVPYTAIADTSVVANASSYAAAVPTSFASSSPAVSTLVSVAASSASSSYADSTSVAVAASAPSSYAVSTPASVAASSVPSSSAVSTPVSTPVATPSSIAPSSYVAIPSSSAIPASVPSTLSEQVLAAPAPSSSAVAQAVSPNSAPSEECSLTTVTVSGSVVTSTVTYTVSTTTTATVASPAASTAVKPEVKNMVAQTPAKADEPVVKINQDDDTTTTMTSTKTHTNTKTMTSTLANVASTGTGTGYPYATGTGMPYPYVNGTRKELRASGSGHAKPSAIPFAGAGSKMEIGWVMMVAVGVVAGLQML